MNNKYKIKTYTNCIQSEISDLEIDKRKLKLESNENTSSKTDTEQNTFLKTTFQPKNIFTNKNNNISFYQSNSKNSYRTSKHYKNLSPFTSNKDLTQNSTAVVSNQSLGEEKFSCNFMALKRKTSNKNTNIEDNQNTQRINIDDLNTKYKKPKRTIKSYKKQFNVEKSDNFNMLSYRPIEYDSDNNYIKKSKINHMFKKQEVNEIFYPSKKTHSPQTAAQNEEIKDKYQTHTLKYQSFFGSFNGIKNSRVAKSTSRIKINQLNDFNIEKLIEIGDKYANLRKPVLPLGKIMNNNILFYNNRIKNGKNRIPINSKIFSNYSYDVQAAPNYSKYTKTNIKEDSEENYEKNINTKTNIMKEKKRVTKKIISKNILKNTKNGNEENMEDNQMNSVMKNLNFNNDLINSDNRVYVRIKKKHSKNNTKESQNNFDNNYINKEIIQNNQEISQNQKLPKRRTNLNISHKYRGINDQNNKIAKNNIIYNIRKDKSNDKNILSEPKLLTDDENNYKKKILHKKKFIPNNDIYVTESKKYNKNNRNSSNVYYKGTNQKNYYGYDERHNLEDTIDNHAYFESIHSKRNANNNLAIDKVI